MIFTKATQKRMVYSHKRAKNDKILKFGPADGPLKIKPKGDTKMSNNWTVNENGNIVFPVPETVKIPWNRSRGDLPLTIEYFNGTMYEKIEETAKKHPLNIALDFMGKHITYKYLVDQINLCAKSLRILGVREDDRVTIAMPNCPQAIYMLYAVNLVGAVANMVHPLSAEKEIENYLNMSNSVMVVTLDQFYHKIEAIRKNTKIQNVIIARIRDELTRPIKVGYMLTEGRKIQKIPKEAPVFQWPDFMGLGRHCGYEYKVKRKPEDPAAILYSGGTTGITKGIVLTNLNFNALGGRCVLVPRFTPKSYAKLITKYRCNFIAGVPTLFEALLRLPSMNGKDLSSLKGVFSGGDSLSIELKKKFDKFLYDHNSKIQVREGYGTTESVTAACLTPPQMHKEGSIGIPFPDMYYKIVKPGTDEEVPYGEEGEILMSGPTVMAGYLDMPEETADTLREHKDGLTWLYTGDLGTMDDEGFIYFRGRAKRMIISSGYNIYPAQLENIFDAHEKVQMSCAVGVPDSYKMQKVKMFVMPKTGVTADDALKEELLAYAKKHIAKYAMPYDIEFRSELPKTLVGKVAYRVLEEEEAEKYKAAQEAAKAEAAK